MTSVVSSGPFTLGEAPSRDPRLAKYFRGPGDPTRLRVLRLLAEESELAAGEIVARLALPQATVSTHPGWLRRCGFVTPRREDGTVIYRIADPRVTELGALAAALLADNVNRVAGCT